MFTPEKPANEAERLAALMQLGILDTNPEERFDRITRIATRLFDVPIAVVSFVESERQWIKSAQGFDIQETPRSTSFCAHAILSNDFMLVEDLTKDSRFYDHPFVTGYPYFKFYLGCPLKVNSYNVGVLCLLDNKPRNADEFDPNSVHALAQMVQIELENINLATTDKLTGLSNRLGLLQVGNYLFRLCQRENKPFSLLFLDLDKFKRINDTYGYSEGNKILKIFADILLQNFRKHDVIARLESDKFCVFCSNLNLVDVQVIIRKIHAALEEEVTNGYSIGFSVGCAQYHPEEHKTLEDMLALAETRIAASKKGKVESSSH